MTMTKTQRAIVNGLPLNIQALLKKYGVRIRKEEMVVTHQTYGSLVTISPEQFAVYEAAVKSCYVANWIGAFHDHPRKTFSVMAWYERIAADQFRLPYISEAKNNEEYGRSAAGDYYTCVRWLRERGLYYRLLD